MTNSTLNINEIKDTVQDGNLNFFVGSGMSVPYFPPLGKIELLLTELEKRTDIDDNQRKIIRVSLYKKYFDDIIKKNIDLLTDTETGGVLESYKDFLKKLNSILLKRKSTILSKQINIFTTNIDIFFERSFEETGVESNDGFSGRFKPEFDLGNFKKSQFKKSLHYDNTSEIPVFNLLKIHGSLTWQLGSDEKIRFSQTLKLIKDIQKKSIPTGSFVVVENEDSIDNLVTRAGALTADQAKIDDFAKEYEKLSIVNPDKDKFKHTLLNQTYYDLLRIYSNELEKENTVLFTMGFSFADEHLRGITLRAANSNPTLVVYVLGHTSKAIEEIKGRFDLGSIKNNNIKFIAPTIKNDEDGASVDEFSYDFKTLNEKIFDELLRKIGEKKDKEEK